MHKKIHQMSAKSSKLLCQRLKTQGRFFGTLVLLSFSLTLVWMIIPISLRPPLLIKFQKVEYSVEHGPDDDTSDDQYLEISMLQAILECQKKKFTTELVQHGDYWVLKNLIMGKRSRDIGCADSITFTTIGDYSFMRHIKILAKR